MKTARALALACLWAAGSPPPTVAQSSAVSLYSEGNELYRQGAYEQARQRYEAATETGVRDARLFYNLGNACFKTEGLGEAILWYERALRLEPRDEDIRANLAFARHVKKDREPVDDSPAVWRFLVCLHQYPTLDELAGAFGLLWLTCFAWAGWSLWTGRRGSGATAFLVTCIVITAAMAGWLGRRAFDHGAEAAIVTAVQTTARSAPEAGETAIFLVHEGTRVRVERREDGWLLIRLANGLGGWLRAEDVTVI